MATSPLRVDALGSSAPSSSTTMSSTTSSTTLVQPVLSSTARQWLTCFALVKFDIDLGPSLAYSYPPDQLTDNEVTNGNTYIMSNARLRLATVSIVCALAFPDSHCAVMGDQTFVVRVRTLRHRTRPPVDDKVYTFDHIQY